MVVIEDITFEKYELSVTRMVAGLYFVICEVLVISGIAKILYPLPTKSALSTIGLPSTFLLVRFLGLTEILLGILGILVGGRYLPIITGALFAFFSIFIFFALRNGQVSSCGCFGATRSPPSAIHLFANLILYILLIRVDGLSDILDDQPAKGIPLDPIYRALAASYGFAQGFGQVLLKSS